MPQQGYAREHPTPQVHPREGAAGTVVSFIAAVAIFAMVFAVATFYLADVAERSSVRAEVDLDSKADDVLSLLISSPGVPRDWHDGADPTRLGLLKVGSSSTVDVDKLLRLQNTSNNVAYEDARAALGIQGYDLHIRTLPVFQDKDAPIDELEGYRLAYVGDHSDLGAEQQASVDESATLAGTGVRFKNAPAGSDLGVALNPGDKYEDDERYVAAYLVPRLAGFLHNNDTVLIEASDNSHWNIVNKEEGSHDPLDSRFDNVLTTSHWRDDDDLGTEPDWDYSDADDDALYVAELNLSGYDGDDRVWVNFTHHAGGTDVLGYGDGGFVHTIAPEDAASPYWEWDAHNSVRFWNSGTPSSFVDESVTLDMSVVAGDSVVLSFTWVTYEGSQEGSGWFIGNVTVEGVRDGTSETLYGNQLDYGTTSVDALVVGSDVNQGVLAAGGGHTGVAIQSWVTKGGDVVGLGTEKMNRGWIKEFANGTPAPANGPLLTNRSDLSHSLLNEPFTLPYLEWPRSKETYGVKDSNAFTKVLLAEESGSERPVTSVSNPNEDYTGDLVLTSWKPAEFASTDRERALINSLLFTRYRELYLGYGATVPEGASVGSGTTVALVDTNDPLLGHQNFRVTVYVWKR